MQRLCDQCNHVYSNKQSLESHQWQTGHKQIHSIDGERTAFVEVKNAQGQLETSLRVKSADVAQLNDSLKVKDNQIAALEDSIRTKEAQFAILHNKITHLSSLEHEKHVVRETLRGLTHESYIALGEQLGYRDIPTPVDNVPVPAVAPLAEPEPDFFIGKKDDPGWKYYDGLGFSIKQN
jgi:chromosome segregation ATPase